MAHSSKCGATTAQGTHGRDDDSSPVAGGEGDGGEAADPAAFAAFRAYYRNQQICGQDEWRACERLFRLPLPLCVRANASVPSATALRELRAGLGPRLGKIPWAHGAWQLALDYGSPSKDGDSASTETDEDSGGAAAAGGAHELLQQAHGCCESKIRMRMRIRMQM